MSTSTPELPQRRHLPTRNHRRKPKLPVVNVIPFLSERENTWCKDKSLPEFYEKPDVVLSSTEACMKPPPTAFSNYSDSSLILNENRPILPLAQSNKPNIYDERSSRRSQMSLEEGSGISYGELRGRRMVFPATPRVECVSPVNAIKKLPKHGFAPTIVDRERKTVKESPRTKPTSLLLRERTEEFTSSHQAMKLKGRRMIRGGLQPSAALHLQKTATLPMRNLDDFYRQLVNSYNRGYAFSPTKSRLSHPQLDAHQANERGLLPFHKANEPLVSLNHESMSERLNKHTDISEAKSAFRVLNITGKPTPIEQNLARDYSLVFDNTKATGTPSANATGQHFTRYLKLKNYNPTQGELFLMVNRESNRPGNWERALRRQTGKSGVDSEGRLNETWYLDADERDIQVSPDMAPTAVGMESPDRKSNNDPLPAPPHKEANPGMDEETTNATNDQTLAQETNPQRATSLDQSNGEADMKDQSESRTEDRIEITTVLPDINSDALP